MSASSSTISPRATLISTASGFIAANTSASSRCLVCAVSCAQTAT